ncbi:MAG: DNA repair protein RecN, partial [Candidatus Eisenbacteria bacterium]|nr:DNA repair protein RecN [Candidatus Eisenbacteria bacterium]
VVTHLPMIASRASHHLALRKGGSGSRTVVRVELVSGKEREQEIARMLMGTSRSDSAMAAARDLLDSP